MSVTFIRTILQILVMLLLEPSFRVFSYSITPPVSMATVYGKKDATGNSVYTGTIKDRCQSQRL